MLTYSKYNPLYIINISLSFYLRESSSDTHSLPPHISSVTFLDKQRPWRMLQVCAHNVQCVCVCVCVCVHRICSSVQQRKEVTRWWGFQNWAAAVEEACALCVFFSPPLGLRCSLFCLLWYLLQLTAQTEALRSRVSFRRTLIIHGNTTVCMTDASVCDQLLWIANMAHVSKRSIFIW